MVSMLKQQSEDLSRQPQIQLSLERSESEDCQSRSDDTLTELNSIKPPKRSRRKWIAAAVSDQKQPLLLLIVDL